MKNLLLILISVILFPTDLKANPFTRDIIHKTAFGEKYIIKKNTLEIYERTVGELLNDYKKVPKYWGAGGYAQNRELEDTKYYRNIYKEECLSKGDSPHSEKDTKIICKFRKEKIDESNEKIRNYQIKSNNKLLEYSKYKPYLEKIKSSKIYRIIIIYNPIFQDLNGVKKIQKGKKAICYNNSIEFRLLGPEYKHASKQLNELERKICRKYAKFN